MVTFEVLTAMSMKTAVFSDVAPCSLKDTNILEKLTASIMRVITLKMEAVSLSETLVNMYWTIWCYNPEDSHLQL
jgi:hypothetical protein